MYDSVKSRNQQQVQPGSAKSGKSVSLRMPHLLSPSAVSPQPSKGHRESGKSMRAGEKRSSKSKFMPKRPSSGNPSSNEKKSSSLPIVPEQQQQRHHPPSHPSPGLPVVDNNQRALNGEALNGTKNADNHHNQQEIPSPSVLPSSPSRRHTKADGCMMS